MSPLIHADSVVSAPLEPVRQTSLSPVLRGYDLWGIAPPPVAAIIHPVGRVVKMSDVKIFKMATRGRSGWDLDLLSTVWVGP